MEIETELPLSVKEGIIQALCIIIMYTHVLYITMVVNVSSINVQWNRSNLDTNGAEESVIVSEVSSFQGLKCMQEWYILGVGKGVLSS